MSSSCAAGLGLNAPRGGALLGARQQSQQRRRLSSSSSSSRPPSKSSPFVVRAGRFRDEEERQRAVDRLSPPSDPSKSRNEGDGTAAPTKLPGDLPYRPPPQITRSPNKRQPKRFKDAMRQANGGLGLNPGGRRGGDEDDEDEGPDPREVARQKRIERKESEASDRLEYLVAVIRQELGKPQTLLALDGKTREIRFDSLRHRLRNFGFVEIMFGLVKYYYAHWNDPEVKTVPYSEDGAADEWRTEDEFKQRQRQRLSAEKEKEEREMDEYMAVVEKEGAEEMARRMGEVLRSVDNDDADADESSTAAGGGGGEMQQQPPQRRENAKDEEEDEAARRALLRAAQLRATGVDPGSRDDLDLDVNGKRKGRNGDGSSPAGGGKTNETLDALADLAREYFSVDFVEDGSGGKEMVVMTSPEFIGFLLVAIILSGRLGHFLVNTYLTTPVDPLLR